MTEHPLRLPPVVPLAVDDVQRQALDGPQRVLRCAVQQATNVGIARVVMWALVPSGETVLLAGVTHSFVLHGFSEWSQVLGVQGESCVRHNDVSRRP